MAAPMLLDGESAFWRPSPQHSTTAPFYKPLDPERAEIRLLTLHPSQFDEDVRCSLHTISLTNGPHYEALSYVWGDPANTLPVIVNGSEIRVTANLEAALRHLRWQEKPRMLWVDAVCLDQNNTKEKNIQVPMMGEVYRQATSVIVWLGQGLGHVDGAIKWAKNFASKQTSKTSSGQELAVLFAAMDMLELFRLGLGLLHLLKHPYWNRMWTYQEYVLATDMPICVYGHLSFSLPIVIEAFKAFLKEPPSSHLWGGSPQPLDENFRRISFTIFREVAEFAEHKTAKINLNRLAEHIRYEPPGRVILAHLLLESAGRASSNPRDRIYALYGLDPSLSREIPVDYSKTESQVVLEATAFMLRSGESESVWGIFELRTDRFSSVKRLPSWTPNLDLCRRSLVRQHASRALGFNESAIEAVHVSSDLTTLHLWARNLGCCKVLQRINGHDSTALYQQTTRTCLSKFSAFVDNLWANKFGSMSRGLCHPFVRCAVEGVDGHEQTSDDDLVEAFKAVCLDVNLADRNQDGTYKSRALELVAFSILRLDNVACIITSSGCVGFAPFDTEDEDLVVLPRYPTPPMVLRKEVADFSQAGREFYIMVGSANVSAAAVAKDEDFRTVVSKVGEIGVAEYVIH